jgi:hypothetical protein
VFLLFLGKLQEGLFPSGIRFLGAGGLIENDGFLLLLDGELNKLLKGFEVHNLLLILTDIGNAS